MGSIIIIGSIGLRLLDCEGHIAYFTLIKSFGDPSGPVWKHLHLLCFYTRFFPLIFHHSVVVLCILVSFNTICRARCQVTTGILQEKSVKGALSLHWNLSFNGYELKPTGKECLAILHNYCKLTS